MKKHTSKITIAILVIAFLAGAILLFSKLYSQLKEGNQKKEFKVAFEKVVKHDATSAKKDIEILEANKIYPIGDGQPVITAIIHDTTSLQKDFPFLRKAYKGDIIITTPKQTVIFDPLTKTVRDISNVSLYAYLQAR
jgi:hypothetical protein